MLSTEEFKAFAAEVVPFLHVTSRVEGEAHPDMLQEKGGRGFPYVVAMDSKGEVIGQIADRTVAGFRAMTKKAAEYVALAAKEKRTAAEELRYVVALHELNKVDVAEARKRVEALEGLDDAGKKERDQFLLVLDIRSAVEGKNPQAMGEEEKIALGKTFHEWWKAGREPTDQGAMQPFFIFMLDYAESAKDAELFEKALGKLREVFGPMPGAAGFFKRQDDRLAKLKEAAPPAEGGK